LTCSAMKSNLLWKGSLFLKLKLVAWAQSFWSECYSLFSCSVESMYSRKKHFMYFLQFLSFLGDKQKDHRNEPTESELRREWIHVRPQSWISIDINFPQQDTFWSHLLAKSQTELSKWQCSTKWWINHRFCSVHRRSFLICRRLHESNSLLRSVFLGFPLPVISMLAQWV
jgi:hypothetical protein